MKAIRVQEFGGPEVLRAEEVPDLSPGEGQVVVRLRSAGINPVDTYIRTGTYAFQPDLPYTPGLDAAGEVEKVGAGVEGIREGDRVYVAGSLSGTYAEQALCNASQVHPLPERLSFAQGAALGVPYGTAWYALFYRAHALPGETVLIHGASGGVGSAAVQIARAAGLRVIGTAGSDRGRELVLKQGGHHVLDHHQEGYLEEATRITGGKGPDVILEMLANVNLDKDLQTIAMRGRIVVIGCRGRVEIDPRGAMGKNAAVLGMVLFNATDAEQRTMHAGIGAGLENGTLNPVIGQEFSLEDAPKAHEAVIQSGAYGKIVLKSR